MRPVKMSQRTHPPVQRLRAAFVSSFCLMAFLTVASHVILKQQIHNNEESLRVTTMVGSLRSSSQRISLLARNLVTTSQMTERVNLRNELSREVRRMETSHRRLVFGDKTLGLHANHSKKISALYYETPAFLNAKLLRFIEESKALVASPDSEIQRNNRHMKFLRRQASVDKILADIDSLVRQYEAESEERLHGLQDLEQMIVVIQLGLLIFVALFIFRPLAERVRTHIDTLSDLNQSLEERVAERTEVAEQSAQRLIESERLAHLDPLTEVLNRRGFQHALTREIAGSAREGSSLAVMIVDLDNFKTINDQFSHAIGDEVLKQVAHILKASLRVNDPVCRIGGDEFIVLLPQTTLKAAASIGEKVRVAIEHAEVSSLAADLRVSASIGIAVIHDPHTSVQQLLKLTHSVLYESKRSGKNRVSCEVAA